MKHIFINNNSQKTLILLHGTGGDEYDMIPIAKSIDEKANILSIRGDVVENGMNRYFKRFSVGVYDLESYQIETKKLIQTIELLSLKYKINLENSTIIGFSNGANIAVGIIQTKSLVNKYILFNPDFINPKETFPRLDGVNIFISNAINDPYVNQENFQLLVQRLIENEAEVLISQAQNHHISNQVLSDSINFYNIK